MPWLIVVLGYLLGSIPTAYIAGRLLKGKDIRQMGDGNIEAANAYRDRTIAEAQGQADRFDKIYESYVAAPEVTRRRMYLETMEAVFGGTDKIILDEQGTGSGVVPYLPLDALTRGNSGGGQ